MNIHEYQAKELFANYGVAIPKGVAATDPKDFEAAIAAIAGDKVVVKSQIHAGGRGKGVFTDGFKGGVHVVTRAEALGVANKMFGNTLVTKQTGDAGRKVGTIYFNEVSSIDKEYYLAILLDRATGKDMIIASTEGGMDIETVAEETPEKIMKVAVSPETGLQGYQARQLAFFLGFGEKELMKKFTVLINGLYKLYAAKDCSMVEVNPLVLTKEGNIEALDAKVSFDDNAMYRHPDIQAYRDLNEEDAKEIEASKYGLNYIKLDGNIACMVNGAGLAMATMDIIKYYGGSPANFLDVGGGATEEAITAAFKILLSDAGTEGILINIFGGIMKCDIIAAGVLGAIKNVGGIKLPLVVRLEGTNVDEGKKILADSGIAIVTADSLDEAAQKIVKIVKK